MGSENIWHLAQANVARMKLPIEHALMERFREQLDAINAAADASAGFIWRLQSAAGNATDIRAFDDPLILFNMSVWTDIESLHAYTYRSAHVGPLRARREWFEPAQEPSLVLWWIPAGTLPTIDEGRRKLRMIAARGPTQDTFSFRDRFPPPDRLAADDDPLPRTLGAS